MSNVLGTMFTKVNFGPFSLKRNLAVIDNLNFDIIVGLDMIDEITVGKSQKTGQVNRIELNGHSLNLVKEHLDQYLCSVSEIEIEAKSQRVIKFANPGVNKKKIFTLVQHFDCPKSIDLLPTVCKGSNLLGMVENKTDFPIKIPSNVPLYSLVAENTKELNNLMTVTDEKSETARYESFMAKRKEKFKPHLQAPNVKLGDAIKNDPLKVSEINSLLTKYNMAFSADKMDIGLIKGFRYQVDMKEGAEPWYQPPRRIPPAIKQELTETFGNDLKHDLLMPGNSPFNIPLVIVKKKDGRFRCCLDMRQGNSKISGTRYPLPDLQGILGEIGQMISSAPKDEQIYIATFDMNSAYRQLEIRDEDKQKFAFTFYNDQYSHQLANKRLIFGVQDAPSSFSMLMRTVLSGLTGTWNYMDDIQLVAVGYDNFILQISQLFERLIKYGITLEQKKSEIGATQTELLGHIISSEGISLVPGKIDAIKNLPSPKNKDQVRSVCGSFAYFIDFVPRLMETLSPLYELLKKNSHFSWSNIHQKAFEKAKKDLSDCTVRNHRNMNYQLVVVSDASNVGCGSMLGQINDQGKIEPLQFYSKIFADAEKRQPIRMRELYAIFYALHKWKSILMAEDFSVLSDHRSLEFLSNTTTNELNVRLFNILYFLGHFSFKVLHVPGRDPRMFTADMLSRAEYFVSGQDREEENSEYEDPTHVFSKAINHVGTFNLISTDEIKTAQATDDFCLDRQNKLGYEVRDSVLYRLNKDQQALLVLPDPVALEIAEYCHKCKGHLGAKRLHDFLKTTFYAKNLFDICHKVTGSCADCISVKYRKKKCGNKVNILDVEVQPFMKVYFDLIDLGGCSDNGFRYGVSYQCSLTRFLDIEPIKDKTNESVCAALLKLFLRYGVPDRAVCDNGKDVMGKTNQILYDMLGIYVSNISPLRPQGNLVERSHKQIGELLKIYNISREKWDIHLPLILFYYNTAQAESLNGLTPFEALYLRPAKTPLSLNSKNKIKKDWTEQFGEVAGKIFVDLAKGHKARFNAQILIKDNKPTVLKRNQRVLIYKPQPKGTSRKLYRCWDGPYRVVKKTSLNVYLLVNIATGRRVKRNIDLIRILPGDRPKNQSIESPTVNAKETTHDPAPPSHDSPLVTENQPVIFSQSESVEPNHFQREKRARKTPEYLRDYQL